MFMFKRKIFHSLPVRKKIKIPVDVDGINKEGEENPNSFKPAGLSQCFSLLKYC